MPLRLPDLFSLAGWDVSSPGDLGASAPTHLNTWLRKPLPGEVLPELCT